MRPGHDVAAVASLLAEPARAAMCMALLDGRALTAGELARGAAIAPSTASAHLARLVDGGLVTVVPQGRHRYFRLAGADVAGVVERLAGLAAPPVPRSLRESRIDAAMRYARTCYDHLAGRVAVELVDALVRTGALDPDLQLRDEAPFRRLGIDVAAARAGRRPLLRPCLDWTERREHLAGALGAAVVAQFLAAGWIEPIGTARAVRVTEAGRRGVYDALACELPAYRAA